MYTKETYNSKIQKSVMMIPENLNSFFQFEKQVRESTFSKITDLLLDLDGGLLLDLSETIIPES